MSSTYTSPLDLVERALDELGAVHPGYRTTGEKQEFLLRVARVKARVVAAELRVLAVADDIAEVTGDRSTAWWLAHHTREAHGTARRHSVLAIALHDRWGRLAQALAAGQVNLAQTRVIVEALEVLPKDLGDGLLVKAETYLVEQAADLGPRELANLGRGVLEHLAPQIAEEAEYQRLLAEEARAAAATRLDYRRRGDGSTDINARVPDHVANRLRAYLDAYANPRRPPLGDPGVDVGHVGEVDRLPLARRQGIALCALLENLPVTGLPTHGGTTTAITVTLDLDTLIAGLGVATTSTGDRVSAEQARRLACQARIVPVVLGRKGEVLDLGRSARLFSPAQRKAMAIRDRECTTQGCSIPAAWCEAHHFKQPWSQGGRTDLADGKLLCSFHHHRAHDPAWQTHHHANGSTTFHRRIQERRAVHDSPPARRQIRYSAARAICDR